MNKLLLSLALFCFLATSAFAQRDRMDIDVKLKNGETVEGMIIYNHRTPWVYQKSISVFDRGLAQAKKIKGSQKEKYKAKDVESYVLDGKTFVTRKMMIAGRGDAGSTLKALPSYSMVELVEEGAINVYKAFAYPPSVTSGTTFEEIYDDLNANPEYFLQKKDDNKVVSMHSANIQKWIADAPETSENFAEGEYGNMKRKEGKKMANFLKGQIDNERPDVILRVVKDYNAEKA